MALTPEDVVNKRFNPTKFREGYDQDEVDDFLDEVVVELRRLNQDNEELRQRLIASEARINELQRGATSTAHQAPAAAVLPEPAPAPVEPPVPAPASIQAEEHVSDTTSTNNLLQLARRLHEEHVREGIQRRDALIAEGHSTAARVVSEAEEHSRAQLAAAEEQTRTQLGDLEARKAELQVSIDQLTAFESEYRSKLKSYIEAQLEQLEHTAGVRREAQEAAVEHEGEQPVHAGGPRGGAEVL